jgi:uncharacterized repeat protein (TIGR03803 family)
MSKNFDELTKGLSASTRKRQTLQKFGTRLAVGALTSAWGIAARADWTPPESSVTPPAVVTLDAFVAPGANGAYPSTALVVGADGALYGSTQNGGAIQYNRNRGYGTLFRVETNGTFTKLHTFNFYDGAYPSELVVGSDGALCGSTEYGGTNGTTQGGEGTLFRVETNGTFTKLHDFNGTDGYHPVAALVVGPDDALYGSTPGGGARGTNGTLFRVETNGTFTKLHDFNGANGSSPGAALVVGPDGALYGSTPQGGASANGTLFRLETNGTFTKLHDFNGTDGSSPSAALVVGPDGALFGSTGQGGTNGYGTLFRLETNGTFTKLHDFNFTDGAWPSAALVAGPDGALYGWAKGGTNGYSTLFRMETNGTFTNLHDLNRADGSYPVGALVVGLDGALYGSTSGGASDDGTLFRLETNGTFTKLHGFNGTDGAEGEDSLATLVMGPDGAFYGSTEFGGAGLSDYPPPGNLGDGTLFRVDTKGKFNKLYDFNGTEGYGPEVALVVGPNGALYGSTPLGGSNADGTLFRLDPNGTFTKLHDFNGTDGSQPSAALVVGPDGALYGAAQFGAAPNIGGGTLFRLATNGIFTNMYAFNGTNGYQQVAPLVVGPDGAFYGSTSLGGTNGPGSGHGTLFRLQTNGNFTKLHDFNGIDGFVPRAAMVVGADGALYGSTEGGGFGGVGTLFRVDTNGTFAKLHDFEGPDGSHPGTLVIGPDGALYGSTWGGGSNNRGTLFRLETNGTFTKLQDFNGTDGANSSVALVVGPDGALYGSTQYGGPGFSGQFGSGDGTLFRLETNGTFTKLHDFNGTNDGSNPSAAMVVGPDGVLYGSTYRSSTVGGGTLFRLDTNGTFAKLYDFTGTNGANPSAPLVVGPDEALYGSMQYGGPSSGGALLKLVLNRPPVARCHDVTVSAGASCAADASVDNGSFDPDAGDTITVRQEPPGPYPVGVTPVMLTVTDNHGASNSCTATVTVMDTTPPTISNATATPNVLWPPNHKMVGVTVSYDATDDCGAVSNALFVTSNESPNGPGNGTARDWVIEDAHHAQLRAERSGTGTGRVYTITVISIDSAGNSSTKAVTVSVPKNQK